VLAAYIESCLLAFNLATNLRDLQAQPSKFPYLVPPRTLDKANDKKES
jgi:hypothetical protein